MLSPMKTECDWWYNSLWRWLPMLKCESLSTTVLFRTTCTLTRMIIFPLLLLSIKSYTLLDYRLPGRGPLQKAYVTLDFISKFLLSFHKVTVGRGYVACLNFKTSCVGVYKCLSLNVGFAVTVAIWLREVVSCHDFILHAVATLWAMSLVGIYPGRAS